MPYRSWGTPGWADPFRELRRIQEDMNRVLGSTGLAAPAEFPQANLYADDDGAVITCELPGVAHGDLEVTVHDDTVTIKGRREPEEGAGITYHRRERRSGAFARTITLPFPVASDKVDARYENGVLTVRMARQEADKPRRIQIRAG